MPSFSNSLFLQTSKLPHQNPHHQNLSNFKISMKNRIKPNFTKTLKTSSKTRLFPETNTANSLKTPLYKTDTTVTKTDSITVTDTVQLLSIII
jgi:hypothetical protein